MRILFFDTETTGLPKNYKAQITDGDNWPRLVQLAFVTYVIGHDSPLIEKANYIKPDGFVIGEEVIKTHGITNEIASTGIALVEAITELSREIILADLVVGHNISFDRKIVGAEMARLALEDVMHNKPRICTMMKSTKYCAIPNVGRGGVKWPKLSELYQVLHGIPMENAHDALADIKATAQCFFELLRRGVITHSDLISEILRCKAAEHNKVDVF